ncbi:MAG: paaK [Deltaproteobacteria bacterium]|nr:paaK [Deltaproteobacteria bacterium]
MKPMPGIFALSPQEIAKVQDGLLREAVEYAAAASPYYRETLAKRGRGAGPVRGLADLPSLPLTSREDIQRRNRDLWAAPMDRVAEIVATTGTTGDPVYVPMTRDDVERLAENERRGFEWLGARPGDQYHVAVTLDNLFVAGMAYHLGLHRLGAAAVRIGAQPARRHLDLMRQLRPDGMVCVPSRLLALARQAKEDGLDVREFAPGRFLLIGDAIRGPDLAPNTLGRLIAEAWGGEMHSTYGLTEAGLAFHECPARRGLHSHPDFLLCEIVDDEGVPLPAGETGELVITTLQVGGMPLLRYRTGDVTFVVPGSCPCGRGGARIGPILGRKRQRLKLKGTTLYPKAIEEALLTAGGVENFVIEAHSGADGTDRVVIRAGIFDRSPAFLKKLNDIIYSKIRVTPEVIPEAPEEVEKALFEGGRRKPRTFVDYRKS